MSELTRYLYDYYGRRLKAGLPFLGHADRYVSGSSHSHVRENATCDAEALGEVPANFIHEQSEGKLSYAWSVQVNRLIAHGGFDPVLSLGQVVPHERAGWRDRRGRQRAVSFSEFPA